MPGPSPLVGYNTNVRHKGKLYHIQTEDSGVNHPHVITHLFADGGRIIASRKTAYAEHLGASDLQSIVKRLMQEQHKALFIELRDCVYDDQPSSPPATSSASGVTPVASPAPPAPAAAVAAPPVAAQAPAQLPVPPAPAAIAIPVKPPAAASISRAAVAAVPAPRFVGTPPPMSVPSRALLALDAETLDRAAEQRLQGSAIGRARGEAARRGAGRYQQTLVARPSRAPRPTSRSVFGGEALRGKSLDEVILSYLSDDTGEGER